MGDKKIISVSGSGAVKAFLSIWAILTGWHSTWYSCDTDAIHFATFLEFPVPEK
jgi:hypothetical protein